ncbi:MAG: S9 family peptidase [Lewinellaceae bacterium]|nr:S9 family peptidase [Lewinellaceae bacterium]
MRKVLAPIFLIFQFQLHLAAQLPLIPRDSFFQQKDQYAITLSPDGSRVYYQRRSVREGRLFYLETQRPGREQKLSFDGALLNWKLTPAGNVLAVVQSNGKQLAIMGADGRNKREVQLFPFQQLRIEALSPERPDEAAVSIVGEKDSLNGIYRVNFRTGRYQKISPPLDFQKIYFDHQLRLRAGRLLNDLNGYSIYTCSDGEWTERLRYPFDESQFIGGFQDVVSVSADGQTVFATDNTGRDKCALVAVDVASGGTGLLVADGKADILPFGAMVAPDGRPQMVLSVFGAARRHFLDGAAQVDFEYANRLLEGQASFADASADGRIWLLRKLDGGPATYYLFDRNSRQLIHLFNDYPALDGYPLASRQVFDVITRDGYELPIHVYLPPGADKDGDGIPEKPLPTVVYVHGGPWAGVVHWNQWFHNRNFQLLANRGYAVINTEFRGSTGLGQAFTNLGDRQWGQAMHQDKVDITRWAIHKGIARKGKIGIWGWSYGGYAAAVALAFEPKLYACGISMYGPADMEAFLQIPFTDNDLWRNRVGNPNTPDGIRLLRQQSPINYVENFQSPILLTTGGKDGRVPKRQVDDFADALYKAGKEVTYFYYPEEVHDYREPGSWISFWAIAEQFLAQNLGGRYEPVGRDLEKGDYKVVYGRQFIGQLK